MSTTALPTVTREQLPSGNYRYRVNGEVHTAKSRRLYTHASAYRVNKAQTRHHQNLRDELKVGDAVVFLHSRADIAANGSSDANRITTWTRIPGVIEIAEHTTTTTTPKEATVANPQATKTTSKPAADKPAAEPFKLSSTPAKTLAAYLTARASADQNAAHRGLPFITEKDVLRVKPSDFTDWFLAAADLYTGTPSKKDALQVLKDAGLVQRVYALPTHDAHPELTGKSFGLYTGKPPAGTASMPRQARKVAAAPAKPAADKKPAAKKAPAKKTSGKKAPAKRVSRAAKDKAIAQVADEIAANPAVAAATE